MANVQENCTSGENTFEEDGPDIEALRVAYDLFINDFNEQQRKVTHHCIHLEIIPQYMALCQSISK